MNNTTKSSQYDRPKRRKYAAVLVVVLLLALACLIFFRHYTDRDTFLPGSEIDGVNVSGMTASQAADKLKTTWKSRELKVRQNGKVVARFSYRDYDYEDVESAVAKAMNPGTGTSLARAFNSSKRHMTVESKPKIDEEKFNAIFYNMSIVKDAKYTAKSKDAYVDLSDPKFTIHKEVYGDELDKQALKRAIMKAVSEGRTTFRYTASDYYIEPELKSTSRTLLLEQNFAKEYLSQKITYEGLAKDYTITPKELSTLLERKNGKAVVNESAAAKFVANTVSTRMSTVGMQRKLKSAGGGTYIVAGGNYGASVDVKKETKQLIRDLKAGKDVKRAPVYTGKVKKVTKGNSDIGDSYVEVDVGRQTVYCVIKGKKVLTSSVVTGNVAEGHATPYGVCYLAYKETDATLKGKNADGSDYESHVDYWMPFNGGVGLHDAPWRGAFGGSIYRTSGSHGCVNMPPANAKKLYHYVYAGIPVIVHP